MRACRKRTKSRRWRGRCSRSTRPPTTSTCWPTTPVVAGAELCLDVLGWQLEGETAERFWARCRQTLDELVAGTWPAWPS